MGPLQCIVMIFCLRSNLHTTRTSVTSARHDRALSTKFSHRVFVRDRCVRSTYAALCCGAQTHSLRLHSVVKASSLAKTSANGHSNPGLKAGFSHLPAQEMLYQWHDMKDSFEPG